MNGAAGITMISAALVVVDIVSKYFAATCLKGAAAFSVLPGFFDLAYVENRGCAWGMFQGKVWPLAAFGVVALAFLIWKRRSVFEGAIASFAEPLLYAGIIGNALDRICRGYVIDMFDWHWKNCYHFPCFNVADICITTAAGLLIIDGFFNHKKELKG